MRVNRILFLTQYSSFYGASQSLFTLIEGLKKNGIESIVVTPKKGPLVSKLEEIGVQTYQIPTTPWVYRSSREDTFFWTLKNTLKSTFQFLRKNLFTIRKFGKIIKKHRIDLIYSNMAIIGIGFIVSKVYRLPHVWHLRSFVDLDFGYKWNLGPLLSKRIINRSELVIANSNAVKKHYTIDERSNIHVIYNGVISEQEYLAISNGEVSYEKKDHEIFCFAIIGSITDAKGQRLAIQAFKRLYRKYKNIQLYIIGKGNIEELKELSQTLEIEDKVIFTGHVDNVKEYYKKIDMILVCSRFEAFGRVTAEAMAAKKPVIGMNSGGTAELIEDGVTGLLFDDSYENLAEKMTTSIENLELLVKLSDKAFFDAGEKFIKENYVQSINHLVMQLTINDYYK